MNRFHTLFWCFTLFHIAFEQVNVSLAVTLQMTFNFESITIKKSKKLE